jgi:hypothetical protein
MVGRCLCSIVALFHVFSWYEDMDVEAVLTKDDETIVNNVSEHTSNI